MNLWFAVFVITVCVVIVLVIVYFARKRVPGGGLFTDSNWAAAAFGVLGTSFAVLLAFVIFLAFESYANAKERSSAEAVAVTELYRDAKLFSDPTGSEVRGQLICYARAVIHDEWPAMREQRTSRKSRWQSSGNRLLELARSDGRAAGRAARPARRGSAFRSRTAVGDAARRGGSAHRVHVLVCGPE
jgi:hypothetical protein